MEPSRKNDRPASQAPLDEIRRIQERAREVFQQAEKCVPREAPDPEREVPPVSRPTLRARLWSATRSALAYAADLPFERFVMAFGLCVFASTLVFVVVRVSKGAPASERAGQAGEPAPVAAATKIEQPKPPQSEAHDIVPENSQTQSEPVLPEELSATQTAGTPATSADPSVVGREHRLAPSDDGGNELARHPYPPRDRALHQKSLFRKPLALPGGVVVMPGEEPKPVFTGPGEMTPEPTTPPGQIPGNERGEIGPWAFQ